LRLWDVQRCHRRIGLYFMCGGHSLSKFFTVFFDELRLLRFWALLKLFSKHMHLVRDKYVFSGCRKFMRLQCRCIRKRQHGLSTLRCRLLHRTSSLNILHCMCCRHVQRLWRNYLSFL